MENEYDWNFTQEELRQLEAEEEEARARARDQQTHFVLLLDDWGDEAMSDEEREKLEEQLNAIDYHPDWGDGPENHRAIWTVRGSRSGEISGSNHYRKPDGTLQILGGSIPEPEGFHDVVERAFNKAF